MRSCKLNELGLEQVKFQARTEHIDTVNCLPWARAVTQADTSLNGLSLEAVSTQLLPFERE